MPPITVFFIFVSFEGLIVRITAGLHFTGSKSRQSD